MKSRLLFAVVALVLCALGSYLICLGKDGYGWLFFFAFISLLIAGDASDGPIVNNSDLEDLDIDDFDDSV